MAKVTVRALENGEDLEEAVAELRMLVYPYLPEVREAEFYSSVYRWFEEHPLANQVHRWVAMDGDNVVGHLSATPQYYRINGRRVVAHTPGDYMVDPAYGFQAISLMRHFFRTAENCVACDMVPAVIGVQTLLGAEVAGDLSYAAKLIDVSRLPTPSVPARLTRLLNRSGTSGNHAPVQSPIEPESPAEPQGREVPTPRPRVPLPAPARALLNGGLRAADVALGKAFGDSLRVETVEEFDTSFDDLFEKVSVLVPCVAEKDAAFLRWRYGPDSPQHPVTVLAVREGNELLGYAALKVTIGSDGYVLDLVRLPGRDDVARALLRAAISHFRRSGVHLIRYRFLQSPFSAQRSNLRRMGFFHRTVRHNTLLTKFSDASLHDVARHTDNWAYNVGDGEASFWTR
ncbi:hypothetical protein BH23ACT11_BH23ACT11_00790 [soil metagenome]